LQLIGSAIFSLASSDTGAQAPISNRAPIDTADAWVSNDSFKKRI
jgi:hypothetical protein